MYYRKFASNSRRFLTEIGMTVGIHSFHNLVIRYRSFDENYVERLLYIKTPCFAEHAKPTSGSPEQNFHEITVDDYRVTGVDITNNNIADFIKNGVGFWLGGDLVGGALVGGIECDLITFEEHFTSVELYLRRSPDYRR